jgi:hypothetical protein
MVLPPAKRELGLQKQVLARHPSALDRSGQGPPDRRFIIMLPLVGGIDAAKPLLDRQLGQALRVVLFPSRAIQEPWDGQTFD